MSAKPWEVDTQEPRRRARALLIQAALWSPSMKEREIILKAMAELPDLDDSPPTTRWSGPSDTDDRLSPTQPIARRSETPQQRTRGIEQQKNAQPTRDVSTKRAAQYLAVRTLWHSDNADTLTTLIRHSDNSDRSVSPSTIPVANLSETSSGAAEATATRLPSLCAMWSRSHSFQRFRGATDHGLLLHMVQKHGGQQLTQESVLCTLDRAACEACDTFRSRRCHRCFCKSDTLSRDLTIGVPFRTVDNPDTRMQRPMARLPFSSLFRARSQCHQDSPLPNCSTGDIAITERDKQLPADLEPRQGLSALPFVVRSAVQIPPLPWHPLTEVSCSTWGKNTEDSCRVQSVGQLRCLDRAACMAWATIRSRRCRRCTISGSDTPLRELRVGDTSRRRSD